MDWKNYTLCAIEPRFDGDDIIYANIKVTPEQENIVQFIENIKIKQKTAYDILCGYEAGVWDFLCIMNWQKRESAV